VAARADRMAGRQQGLAEHHPGLGHVGVRRVTQPGLPVRQQLDRQLLAPVYAAQPAAGFAPQCIPDTY
jgi:hypothetical protein